MFLSALTPEIEAFHWATRQREPWKAQATYLAEYTPSLAQRHGRLPQRLHCSWRRVAAANWVEVGSTSQTIRKELTDSLLLSISSCAEQCSMTARLTKANALEARVPPAAAVPGWDEIRFMQRSG